MNNLPTNPYRPSDAGRGNPIDRELEIRAHAFRTLLPAVGVIASLGGVGLIVLVVEGGEVGAVGGLLSGIGFLAIFGFGYGFAIIRWPLPRFHWLVGLALVPCVFFWVCIASHASARWTSIAGNIAAGAVGIVAISSGLISLVGWWAYLRFPRETSKHSDWNPNDADSG